MNRNIMQEKLDILFLLETKSGLEGLEKIKSKIWKGCQLMALDVVGQAGGIAILWKPSEVELLGWRDNKYSLMVEFCLLNTGFKVTLGNIYNLS